MMMIITSIIIGLLSVCGGHVEDPLTMGELLRKKSVWDWIRYNNTHNRIVSINETSKGYHIDLLSTFLKYGTFLEPNLIDDKKLIHNQSNMSVVTVHRRISRYINQIQLTIREISKIPSPYDVIAQPHIYNSEFRMLACGFLASNDQDSCIEAINDEFQREESSYTSRTVRFLSTMVIYLFVASVCILRGTIMCIKRRPLRQLWRRYVRVTNNVNANQTVRLYSGVRFLFDQSIIEIMDDNTFDENSITRPNYEEMFPIMKVGRRLPDFSSLVMSNPDTKTAIPQLFAGNEKKRKVEVSLSYPDEPLSPLPLLATEIGCITPSTSCENTPERPFRAAYCTTINDNHMGDDGQRDHTDDEFVCNQDSAVPICYIAGRTCPICLGLFETNELVTSCHQGCKNWFHTDCLFEWLDRSANCPYCRKTLLDMEHLPHRTIEDQEVDRVLVAYNILEDFSSFLGYYTH